MKHLFLFVLLCTSVLYPITITVNVHYDFLDNPIPITTKFIVNDTDTTSVINWHPSSAILDSIVTFKLTVQEVPWSGSIKIVRSRFTFTTTSFSTIATTDVTFNTYAKINMLTIVGKTIAANGDPLSDIKIVTHPIELARSKNGTYTISKNLLASVGVGIIIYHTSMAPENTIMCLVTMYPPPPSQVSRATSIWDVSDSIYIYNKFGIFVKAYYIDDTIHFVDYVVPLEPLTGKVLTFGNEPINDVSIKLIGNTTIYDTTDTMGEFSIMSSPQFHGYIVPSKTNYTFTPAIMEVNFADPIVFKGKLNTGTPEFTCKITDTILDPNTIGYLFNIDYNNPTSLKDTIIILKLPSWLAFVNNKLIGINQATSIYDTVKLALKVNNINVDTLILTLYMPNVVSIITPIKHLTKNYTISQIALYDLKGRLITICSPNNLNKILASKSKMIVITKTFTKSFSFVNKSITK
jgi:hypothetical protein